MGPPTDSDRAFVDIVANTFGVIVLLTLFVFIASTPFSSPDVGEVQTERQTIDFAPSKRFLFPPYSHHFLLYQGRILEIDLNAVAAALAQAPDRFEVPVSYGVFQLWDGLHLPGTTPDPTVDYLFSDVDFYRLTLNLTRAAEPATGTPLPPDQDASFMAKVQQISRTAMPSFLVHPTGMERFARLYPQLLERHVRIRWQLIGEKVVFDRTQHFNRR